MKFDLKDLMELTFERTRQDCHDEPPYIEEITFKELLLDQLQDAVKDEVKKEMSYQVRQEINGLVKEETAEFIKNEIKGVLSKPVETDDGWGKKESYVNFEDLVKKTFHEKLDKTWEMKSEIERHVKRKVEDLFKNELKDIGKQIGETISSNFKK